MIKLRLFVASAIFAVASAMSLNSAQAVPISPGDDIIEVFKIAPGGTNQLDFEPTTNVIVSIISISGSGFAGGLDLGKVLFGVGAANTAFSIITANGPTSSAEGSLPSFTTASPFSIFFDATGGGGTAKTTGYTLTYTVSQIPLPASVLLLLSALGGLGFLSMRTKTASA